jgi:Uma2 family endonuclease
MDADSNGIHTLVQPDLCVVCDLSKIDIKGCVGAPDWVVEILSPSTAKKDLNEKFELYQRNGVPEYWIIQPHDRTLTVLYWMTMANIAHRSR